MNNIEVIAYWRIWMIKIKLWHISYILTEVMILKQPNLHQV